MSKFIWSEDYSVGNPLLDQHHVNLIELFNVAYDALSLNDDQLTRKLLSELTTYAVMHFSQEEQMMRQAHFSDYDAHLAEHKDFVAKVLSFKKDFTQNRAALNEEVFLFLFEWLTHHILTVDKKYSNVIGK